MPIYYLKTNIDKIKFSRKRTRVQQHTQDTMTSSEEDSEDECNDIEECLNVSLEELRCLNEIEHTVQCFLFPEGKNTDITSLYASRKQKYR